MLKQNVTHISTRRHVSQIQSQVLQMCSICDVFSSLVSGVGLFTVQ